MSKRSAVLLNLKNISFHILKRKRYLCRSRAFFASSLFQLVGKDGIYSRCGTRFMAVYYFGKRRRLASEITVIQIQPFHAAGSFYYKRQIKLSNMLVKYDNGNNNSYTGLSSATDRKSYIFIKMLMC